MLKHGFNWKYTLVFYSMREKIPQWKNYKTQLSWLFGLFSLSHFGKLKASIHDHFTDLTNLPEQAQNTVSNLYDAFTKASTFAPLNLNLIFRDFTQCKCGYFFLDFGFLLLIGLATKSSSSLNLVIEKKIWRRRRLLRRQNPLKLSSRHHRDLLVVAFQPVVLRNRRARIARVPRTVQTAVGHPSVEPRRVLRRPAVHLSVVGRVVL